VDDVWIAFPCVHRVLTGLISSSSVNTEPRAATPRCPRLLRERPCRRARHAVRRRAQRRSALLAPRRPCRGLGALQHEPDLPPRRAHVILRPAQRPAAPACAPRAPASARAVPPPSGADRTFGRGDGAFERTILILFTEPVSGGPLNFHAIHRWIGAIRSEGASRDRQSVSVSRHWSRGTKLID